MHETFHDDVLKALALLLAVALLAMSISALAP